MLVLFVPLEVVVEQVFRRLFSKSPLPQRLLLRFNAELDEAAKLDTRIFGGAARLGRDVKNAFKDRLSSSMVASAPVQTMPQIYMKHTYPSNS